MKRTIFKPSAKMLDVYHNAHRAKFRLLEGPVRSGKSYVTNQVALKEIMGLPPCNVLISGYTISSVARNVIAEWRDKLSQPGQNIFSNVRGDKDDYLIVNYPGLSDKRFYVRGAGKEHDHKQIQGATFGYWLPDEFTRHTESFTDMAMTRLSPPFAKAIATTNVDSPFHYVKRRFIDDEALYTEDAQGNSLWRRWQFHLGDNPSLTRDYIRSLDRMYSGVFHKRYILGIWCIAEGVVYDFFDDVPPYVIPKPPGPALSHVVGIDYGTTNPTVFGLFGLNPFLRPRIWLEREWYYAGGTEGMKQLTDTEQSAELRKFLGDMVPTQIIVDPSAASFKVQLLHDGFNGVTDAVNDVLDGIRTQARMHKNGEYAILVGCDHTIEEFGAYSWDEKAKLKGLDMPLKQNDHCCDMQRYVLHTLFGEDSIDYNLLTKA